MNLHSTGYGPSSRLYFDGSESKFELWQVKSLGYLRIQKLHKVIDALPDSFNSPEFIDKNSTVFVELIQCLHDGSLSLIMREALNDGRKALNILREHYLSKGKPTIISLYTELTSLKRIEEETVTDYIIGAETTANVLRLGGEIISDTLLISMVIKGLPSDYKP